jgi:hypothetical protein
MPDSDAETMGLDARTAVGGYLQPSDVEALARMLNALLTEHWIMCDRVVVMERLLIERGALEPGQVDGYVPSGEFAATLEALRNTVFAKVLQAPFASDSRTVENLKACKP